MKMLVGLLSLALSFASIASSGETKTFIYDGSQNSVELMLRGEKTHTEYRYEDRTTTCYRTEIVGYRTICTGGGHPGPGYPGPRPYPGRQCYQEPIYRQVAYSCVQTVRIPYEVKDFDVDARVLIDVTKLSAMATPGETLKVTLYGDDLSISASGSKLFIINLKKQNIRTNINGSVKFMDALYAVEMIEAAPILKALKMTSISLQDSVLTFALGPVENRANIGFSLNILKKRIGQDTVLFNRELASSEVMINASNTGAAAGVNVEKLGVKFDSGKYSLTAKAFFKAEGTLMNKSQFPELEASRTLLYKIR